MKTLVTIILVFFLSSNVFSQSLKKDTLVFGSDFYFPPYESINKKGEPEGFNIDIIWELAREMNVKIVVKLDEWEKIRQGLEVDETIDFSDMFYSKTRDSIVDYAFPHDIIYNKVYLHKSSEPIIELNNLNGKKVAVLKGSILEEYLNTKFPEIELIPKTTESEALKMVSNKLCDAAIVTNITGNTLAKPSKIKNIVGYGNMILPTEYCFVVKEGNTELLKKINLGLANLIANGTIEKLRKKWFEEKVFGIRQTYIKVGFIGMLLLLALIYFLNYSLKRTIRKRSSQLSSSEERWKFALEGAGDGIWDWNAITNEVYYSTQWKKMLGFEENEIGNTLDEWEKRVHPEDKEQVDVDLKKHFEGKTEFYINEHRMLCKDGSYKWILDRGKVMKKAVDGKPLRVIGTHTDITEQKEAKEKIEKSHEYNRMLFDQSSIGLALTKMNGKLEDVNQAFADIIGRSIEETKKLSYWDITPEKYKEQENIQLISLQETGKYGPYEKEYMHKNGNLIPVQLRGKIIERDGEHFIWSSVEDITERMQKEKELQQSEERFRTIFEQSASGMCLTSIDGKLINVNSPLCEMLDYSASELIGKHFNEITHPNDLKIGNNKVQEMMEGKSKKVAFEKRYLKKSGESIWVHIGSALLRNDKGKPEYFVTQMEDITQRIESVNLLTSSENKFKALVEQSLTGIYIFEKEKFIYVNSRFCEIFGYSQDEIFANMKPTDVISIEDRERANDNVRKRLASEVKSVHYVAKGNHKTGKLLWVEIHGTHLEMGGKDVITGTVLDITDRKIAEEEIRKLNEELELKVAERTHELETKISEIQRINNLFVGRELRMKELKSKIKELEEILNKKQ